MSVFCVVPSPIGPLTLVSDGTALTGLYMDAPGELPDAAGWQEDISLPVLGETARQLTEYFTGRRHAFELPLRWRGTEFMGRVWHALTAIPCGETRSYGQLARQLGSPGASRAVGLANARNPIAIIVPCHRVVGTDGSLTGFGGGLPRKQWLLDHERSLVRPAGLQGSLFG